MRKKLCRPLDYLFFTYISCNYLVLYTNQFRKLSSVWYIYSCIHWYNQYLPILCKRRAKLLNINILMEVDWCLKCKNVAGAISSSNTNISEPHGEMRVEFRIWTVHRPEEMATNCHHWLARNFYKYSSSTYSADGPSQHHTPPPPSIWHTVAAAGFCGQDSCTMKVTLFVQVLSFDCVFLTIFIWLLCITFSIIEVCLLIYISMC